MVSKIPTAKSGVPIKTIRNFSIISLYMRCFGKGIHFLRLILLKLELNKQFGVETSILIRAIQVHILKDEFLIAFLDRKSTRLNSSHVKISYAVFCLKK